MEARQALMDTLDVRLLHSKDSSDTERANPGRKGQHHTSKQTCTQMAHGPDILHICSITHPEHSRHHDDWCSSASACKSEQVKSRLEQAPDCWSQLIRSQDTLGRHTERLCHLDEVGVDVFHLIC